MLIVQLFFAKIQFCRCSYFLNYFQRYEKECKQFEAGFLRNSITFFRSKSHYYETNPVIKRIQNTVSKATLNAQMTGFMAIIIVIYQENLNLIIT